MSIKFMRTISFLLLIHYLLTITIAVIPHILPSNKYVKYEIDSTEKDETKFTEILEKTISEVVLTAESIEVEKEIEIEKEPKIVITETEKPIKQEPKLAMSEENVDVMNAIQKTSEQIGLDFTLAKVLVHAESVFNKNCTGYNSNSTDYGLCQINSRGEVLYDFINKRINLADGRENILVTYNNYQYDVYINLMMGLSSYKRFLALGNGNPHIAYACYNAGSGVMSVFNGHDMANLSVDEVCNILNNSGIGAYKHASRNIRGNFYPTFKMYH